jgi:hypothetical protein
MGFALVAVGIGAVEVNIAPDAVTRATQGYNIYEGELAFLTDGLYPGNSDMAEAFIWPTKGNLIFQFDEPRPVAGLRLAIGENAGSYSAIAYLGARFGESGQTEMPPGAEVVADAYDFDFAANTWVELAFPPDTETDYIELITESGAEIYEIEILTVAPEPTAVKAGSWGEIKARHR